MGRNNYGQMGDGTTTDVTTPTQIGSFTNVTFVKDGGGTVFFIDSGKLYGIGANSSGQQGNGTTTNVTTPTQIGSFTNVTSVTADYNNAFFIDSGKLYGMGSNYYSQMGDGTTTNVTTPTQIGSLTNVTFVTNASGVVFFIDSGKLYGIGHNNYGQQGNGTTTDVNTPTQIGSFTNVSYVACTEYSTFFIDSGKLYGMGANSHGEQGTASTANVTTPTQIGSFTNVSYVISKVDGTGANRTTAFVDGNNVYVMGSNTHNQLKAGSTADITTPTLYGANAHNINISPTASFSIDSGKLYGMGQNTYGQIGNGTTTNVTTPTQIGSFTNVSDVVLSQYETFFIELPPTVTVTVTPNDSDYGTVSSASITDIEPGDTITIANNTITYGETVVTATPAVADAQYTYIFSGFVDSNSDPITGTVTVNSDMTITAVFTATTNQYAVTIAPNDPSYGSVSPTSLTVDYGTAITVDGTSLSIGAQAITATPTTADAQYTYAFSSWSVPDAAETVTGAITITGTFTATVNTYTVTIESADDTLGTVSPTTVSDVLYGTAITVDGDTITIGETTVTATTTEAGDGRVTQWSVSNGATVQGDMIITASFIEPSNAENSLLKLIPFLLVMVLVVTAVGGLVATGGNPESLVRFIIMLAVGVVVVAVFVLPIMEGL